MYVSLHRRNMDETPVSVEEGRSFLSAIPVTSSTVWQECSERWKPQFEKLSAMKMEEVKTVMNLTFCMRPDYQIGRGSDGSKIYLGLRNDGTEVAIRCVDMLNYRLLKHEEQLLRMPELMDCHHCVQYADFGEDDNFAYLALRLYEYTLVEFIDRLPDSQKKTRVKEILRGVEVLHNTNVVHRDIRPENVVIDIRRQARLSGFASSIKLEKRTTHEEIGAGSSSDLEKASDIQALGKLTHFILYSGKCEAKEAKSNLDLVEDELAKALIKWMIQDEPSQRPTVEEALAHPYFWENYRRVEYLVKVGKLTEAENFRKADERLLRELEENTQDKSFSAWRDKFPPEMVQKLDEKQRKAYPENTLALLRFIRNFYEHHAEDAEKIDLMGLVPDLFPSVYKFAEAKGWNSRPNLKNFLMSCHTY